MWRESSHSSSAVKGGYGELSQFISVQKDKEKDPRNYRPLDLTSNHDKVMDQIILEAISKSDWSAGIYKTGIMPEQGAN